MMRRLKLQLKTTCVVLSAERLLATGVQTGHMGERKTGT
jgi:hypothetical protein